MHIQPDIMADMMREQDIQTLRIRGELVIRRRNPAEPVRDAVERDAV